MSENYLYGTSPAPTNPIRILEVKILNALNGGSTGGGGGIGSGFVLQGTGAPVSAPANQNAAAIYTDLSTGDMYTWNATTHVWF